MIHTVLTSLGVVGCAIILALFWATTHGWMKVQTVKYVVLSILANLLLLASLVANFNLGSFILEIALICIAVSSLIKLRRTKHGTR